VTTDDLVGQALTTFDVASDGQHFQVSFVCRDYTRGSLRFVTECLKQLVMTLPRLMTQALQARYRDESLRLVYPVGEMRIEQSSGSTAIIVTLVTHDGFDVSFGFTPKQLKHLGVCATAAEQMTGQHRGRDCEGNQNHS
jgi:hypothetical protein